MYKYKIGKSDWITGLISCYLASKKSQEISIENEKERL